MLRRVTLTNYTAVPLVAIKHSSMNKLLTILILPIILHGCTINRQHVTDSKIDRQKFDTFINRFKVLKLPYSFDQLCIIDSTINVELDMDNDSTFIGFVGPCITIGILPDTSRFFKILFGIGATCYIPNIAIFKKDGTKVSEEQLAFGCGAGPGYACYDSVYINTNDEIIHKRLEYSFQPDKNFQDVKDSASKEVNITKYKITKQGHIFKTVVKNYGY
jgi:hypothetical protein